MLNLIISLSVGVAVFFGFYQWLQSWWQALPPALIAFPALYYYLSRRVWKQLEAQIMDAYKILEPMAQRQDIVTKVARRNALIDEAIKKLKEAYPLQKWQFMVEKQIDGHVGVMLYRDKQDMSAAQPYLEKSFQRNWIAQGMLACLYMRKHKPELMEKTFELAVNLNKKQDLLWNLYAFCMAKIKQRDKAIEILNRGLKALPNNRQIVDNLAALQNNKKMRMKDYGEQWYQFHVEKPPQQKTKNARFTRK